MKTKLINYNLLQEQLPKAGQHFVAAQQDEQLVVYQAYKPSTAIFSVQHQCLGGPEYSYNRMSWIKPNFCWMMYRCGWAQKENQQRVLAIWIQKSFMEEILGEAVFSSFNDRYYASREEWNAALKTKEVRLQWDPDHDPYGRKLNRRAIQLGLSGKMLEEFGKRRIQLIEDITEFVHEQKKMLYNDGMDKLKVPAESIWKIGDPALEKRIGIDV